MNDKIKNIPPSSLKQLDSIQKYDLNNLPSFDECGWIIEQYFLRHIKSGTIPNLEKYLQLLNANDWICLMAYNPRPEFAKHLTAEIMKQLDWDFILDCQPDFEKITQIKPK